MTHTNQKTKAPFTWYNLLANRFENRLYHVFKHSTGCQTRWTTGLTTGCIVYTAGCQTGYTTRFDNQLNEQWLFVQHGCQSGWMLVYMIQPVVKPVVSCKRALSWWCLRQSAIPGIWLCRQNLNGSHNLTTPLSGMPYHTRASNCYRQSTYQIWSLCLHSLRRYERRYKMSKWGWFGVVSVTQDHWK